MAIPDHHKENFEMLLQAFKHEHVSIVECKDNFTEKPVIVVAASFRDKNGAYNMVPFAKMFEGNPYEEVTPPATFMEEDYISRAMKFVQTATPIMLSNLLEEFFMNKSKKYQVYSKSISCLKKQ